MNIEYLFAKNGEKTLNIEGIFYHSSYNPSKEAERFIQSINFPYKVEVIFLVEPGFSYIKKYLLEKFPNTKIVCIRLIKELKSNDWDFTIDYKDQTQIENYFLYNFDEVELLKSTMISWPSSQKLFKDENDKIWKSYKNALTRAKTLLVTRQYFEKKWLSNSCRFFSYVKNISIIIKKINFPVIITASGPSLKDSLPLLKKFENRYFLLALSSSVKVLLDNNIIPDIIISTDGGFWAGEHLKELVRNHSEIPLVIPSEAFLQTAILKQNPIIPLRYNDGLSNQFFEESNFPNMSAKRNGTVSGTALNFIEDICDENIYFCGLDLALSKGFQHSQRNELEINNSLKDFRIQNKETRIAKSELNSASLDIYLKWFSDYKFKNKTYRIIENPKNTISEMTDISIKEFEEKLNTLKKIEKTSIIKKIYISDEELKKIKDKLSKLIEKNLNSEEWKKELFPIDYLSISHTENINDKNNLIKNLEEKTNKIQKRLQAAINE